MKSLNEFINGHKSVAAAARELGVTRQTVDRWRTGKFKPSKAQVELGQLRGVDLTLETKVLGSLDHV